MSSTNCISPPKASGTPENEFERYTVTKMNHAGKAGAWDKSMIRYNAFIDVERIPRTHSVTCSVPGPGWIGSSNGSK